jgi:hypothetical protein
MIPVWANFLLAAAVVFGIAIIWLALRGRRVDDHPLCRKCGYDLSGLPATSECCSECGRNVREPNSTKIGHRQVRRRLLACGLVVLLPTAGWLALVGFMAVRRIDPNHYRPVSWLLADAEQANAATSNAAFAELNRRLVARILSDAQIGQIVDRAFKHQVDLSNTWNPLWGDFIEDAYDRRLIPEEKHSQFLQQGVVFEMEVRPQLRQGVAMPWSMTGTSRFGSRNYYQVHLGDFALLIDGMATDKTADITALEFDYGANVVSSSTRYKAYRGLRASSPALTGLALGRHTAGLEGTISIHRSTGGSGPLGPKLTEKSVAIEVPWQLVSQPTVRAVSDPSAAMAIEQAITLLPFVYPSRIAYRGGTAIPMPLAFQVIARWKSLSDGQTQTEDRVVGTYSFQNGIGLRLDIMDYFEKLPATKIDVVFRSSADVAESTLGIIEFWDGEIVIHGVPVLLRRQP